MTPSEEATRYMERECVISAVWATIATISAVNFVMNGSMLSFVVAIGAGNYAGDALITACIWSAARIKWKDFT